MRRSLQLALTALLVLEGCSGDDTTNATTADASTDASKDVTTNDAETDSGSGDALPDVQPDAQGDGGTDAACPTQWTVAPAVDPVLDVPDGGGGVLMHAAATGTQNYTCSQVTVDGGTAYQWVFVGPQADLADCNGAKIGQHFASDAGAAAPEWQTNDGAFVIGKKLAAFTPDGGAASVAWLLVQATSNGGTSTLSKAGYVQRLNTDGGVAPSASTCDQNAMGTTQKVGYTADYFFYGTP
jgi:hypothetical protein